LWNTYEKRRGSEIIVDDSKHSLRPGRAKGEKEEGQKKEEKEVGEPRRSDLWYLRLGRRSLQVFRGLHLGGKDDEDPERLAAPEDRSVETAPGRGDENFFALGLSRANKRGGNLRKEAPCKTVAAVLLSGGKVNERIY